MTVRALRSDEKRTLALLGLPTGALALAITVVTTYVPVAAQPYVPSNLVIGGLIGLEGIVALLLPVWIGRWSDRAHRRLPFMLAGAPVVVAGLVALAFVASLPALAIALVVFFVAYFVAYEPYRALYPDLVDDEIAGRAQSTQAVWRGAGTGLALVGGGMLVSIGTDVAFLAGAGLFAVAMAAFLIPARRREEARVREQRERDGGDTSTPTYRELLALLGDRADLRAYLGANTLWEASLGALKTFVFLYVIQGLGKSEPAAAGIIGGVALLVLIAAPVTGRLADAHGRGRVLAAALPVYGLGLLVPAFTTSAWVLVPVMLVVGFGGAMVMSLPYALLQPLMPDDHHGLLTGFYSVSRGLGTALGPALAGLAVTVLEGPFSSTDGYAAMWLVCGATILLSIPFLRALRRRVG